MGQKSVYEVRYHGSLVRLENSNLIEEMSEKTVKVLICNDFSPFFFASLLCSNIC
jgi:hypothetical protein